MCWARWRSPNCIPKWNWPWSSTDTNVRLKSVRDYESSQNLKIHWIWRFSHAVPALHFRNLDLNCDVITVTNARVQATIATSQEVGVRAKAVKCAFSGQVAYVSHVDTCGILCCRCVSGVRRLAWQALVGVLDSAHDDTMDGNLMPKPARHNSTACGTLEFLSCCVAGSLV